MNPVAIILAQGDGKSFGHPEALMEYEAGRSFLRTLTLTFQRAECSVLAVIGAEPQAVRDQHPELTTVESPNWANGPLVAVKDGITAALEEGAQVVLIHPVDMPTLRTQTVKTLLRALSPGEMGVIPEFESALGNPVCLSREGAEKLRSRPDDEPLAKAFEAVGLRRIVTKDPGVVVRLSGPDVYERIFGSQPKLAPPPKRRARAG